MQLRCISFLNKRSSRISIQVAVIHHSGYGHTAKQAEAVARGASSTANTESLLIKVDDIDQYWDRLETVDAIIFGAPTHMGSASAQFKTFMDATSKTVFAKGGKWANKVAAGFTNSASRSGDKLATLQQLTIFAAQHGMHWINLGLPSGQNSSTATEDALNRHSFFLDAGAQSNADQGPEVAALELALGRKALATA